MSYYYSYYIGLENKKSNLIIPFGIYDYLGNLKPVIKKSKSCASDLHEYFYEIPSEKITYELEKEFEYTDWQGNKQLNIKYLRLEELPCGDYIMRGYFLIDDVQAWEQGGDDSLFYHKISPEIYSEKMRNELTFGKNQPKKDDEGLEYTESNASDYMYYAVPNYNSKEYEAELIRQVVEMMCDYDIEEKYNIVILETEG